MRSYWDITGDGGSRILDQVVARRRAIDGALAGVRHLVAVGSGKGGVGKSTVTMALAWALGRLGHTVAILDADLNGPSQARFAGLETTPWVPAGARLALPRRTDGLGVVSVGSLLARGEPTTFASPARGDEHTWRATREMTVLGDLLAGVDWGTLDLLLVDLPPGPERTLHHAELLGRGVSVVLVTIPSEISRSVVARAATGLAERRVPILGVVENMAGYYCRECGAIRPLFPEPRVPEPQGLPVVGRIPFDPHLAALCDDGWPPGEGVDASPATDAAIATARRLLTTLETRA